MATWRLVGSIEPREDCWLLLPELPTGNFFRFSCLGVPTGSASFLQLREWKNQRPGATKIVHPLAEQVFEFGEPGERLISIRKNYPLRSAHDLVGYQVVLEEFIATPTAPNNVQNSEPTNLWLPGNH